MNFLLVIELLIALALISVMVLSTQAGYWWGRHRNVPSDDLLLGTISGASLGLVALLLGFSFAMVGNRFVERQDLIVKEANALGTAFLRADLLESPYREAYRQTLRDYTASRIRLFQETVGDDFKAAQVASESLHPVMWKAAMEGVRKSPQFDKTVLPPLNEVIDLHTVHIMTMYRHLPLLVLCVLIACAMLALISLGYGCGLRNRRNFILTSGLGLLLAMVFWLVIDLDYPRAGILRINQSPMLDLQKSMMDMSR